MQHQHLTASAAPARPREPHAVSGWALDSAIHLNALCAGYLAYLCQTSDLKRQANFFALAVVRRKVQSTSSLFSVLPVFRTVSPTWMPSNRSHVPSFGRAHVTSVVR